MERELPGVTNGFHGPVGPSIFVLSANSEILDQGSVLPVCFNVRQLTETASLERALEESSTPDIILLDGNLMSHGEERNVVGILARLHARHPTVPVIMLPSWPSPTKAAGACLYPADLLLRYFGGSAPEIEPRYTSRESRTERTNDIHQEILLDPDTSFVRASVRMREIESQCGLVARTNIPVLILGESGTGKEVAAKLIHKLSARAERLFLKVNCAAMPADLLESELFGYEQGAFTGAIKSKPGKFEICNNGTIFLDEIGEMPCTLQAKLLQVLQDGSFSRLGSRTSVKVDVRVIAATNIDMKAAIGNRSFREDLYYRLNGFTVRMPPLRERTEEIPILSQHFMRKAASKFQCHVLPIPQALMHAFLKHAWPGNLRELDNVIKRYLILGDEQAIINDLLPLQQGELLLTDSEDRHGTANLKYLVRSLKGNAESAAIAQSLRETGWNRKAAAVELQISYKALLYKIKQYNLAPPHKRLARDVSEVC